ncbi:MAG: SDR family NAD(P)-dependent oxidoreductase [Hespellia sp.]|nr:SDR family NAD(P)-dependent oxidoreductase [Hespellia sp.]
MKLENKVAVVTGAGKGIGREIALAAGKEGATVVLVSRTKEDLDKVVVEIEAEGGKAMAIPADLTNAQQTQAMVDRVMDTYGRIDILVNNAGGYPKEIYTNIEHQAIKIWDWSEEQWDQIIKTNLKPPFLCTNKITPIMIKQRSGKIVNISSRMGRIASQMGAYAVAKGGIVTLTKTTAIQMAEYGVQVNSVAPGILDTPGQRVYNHSVGQDDVKMGSADSVAKAAMYLLCDAPDVMTGQVLDLWTTL